MLGVSPKLLEDLVQDVNNLPEEKLRAIILFALKCSHNPQSLTEKDFEQLRKHHLGHSEIIEIIAMAAFAVYANIIADATAMNPDEMFKSIGIEAVPENKVAA
jgi:alkylhydroperoxidase family enzyme